MEKWRYNVELPARGTGKKKIPSNQKGIVFCSSCRSAYYKKSWHHITPAERLKLKVHDPKPIFCPACQMIKNKEFEGQLTIGGFPLVLEADLNKLIKNFCQRAFERDPLHRLIDIKNDSGNLTATTTENQLAVKLAKKIKEVFGKNKVQVKISYSPSPSDAVYVKINFVQ